MIPARTRQDEINDVHIEIEKKGREEKGKKQECSVGTMLTTWVSTGGAHHDDDGHTQALIALTWVIKMKSLSWGESLNVREAFVFIMLFRIRGP